MEKFFEISIEELKKKILSNKPIFIDIRDENSFNINYIDKFINISSEKVLEYLEKNLINKNTEIYITCYKGIKSIDTIKNIRNLGYINSFSIIGGFESLKSNFNELVKSKNNSLSENEINRYSRQIILKEVGIEGQEKLLQSKVLVIGAGGLGSPILLYLASSGIGTIGIIDPDIVDVSNLHRQVIHFDKNVGLPKVESAKETINLINPNTKVITYKEKISQENALNIICEYDLVIDGTDNFTAKYLINDACYFLKKPLVFGSIFKFDGQVSVFTYKDNTPCYRCIFPELSELSAIPNCAEAGVLGILAGIVGNLQAMESIKVILGIGNILESKILLYDSLETSFRTIRYKQNKECKLCSTKEITEIKEVNYYCKI